MLINFEELPGDARVWIFQADRKISDEEKKYISGSLDNFLQQWSAHGQSLKTSSRIFYDHFVVVGLDEGFNQSSGCSIDALVHAIQQIGENQSIDFFNRNIVAVKKDQEIDLVPLSDVKNGNIELDEEAIIFNNLVKDVSELKNKWETTLSDSWLKRFLPKTAS